MENKLLYTKKLTVGIDAIMRRAILSTCNKAMRASMDWAGGMDKIQKIRLQFDPAYTIIAKILHDMAVKKTYGDAAVQEYLPADLSNLQLQLMPTLGYFEVTVQHKVPEGFQPYCIRFVNAKGKTFADHFALAYTHTATKTLGTAILAQHAL